MALWISASRPQLVLGNGARNTIIDLHHQLDASANKFSFVSRYLEFRLSSSTCRITLYPAYRVEIYARRTT
jgi:hypothetical protein